MFRQLFDPESFTYTYLLADDVTLSAVLIDPVREQVGRDLDLINELGLKLVWTLETHMHADHITGASQLQAKTEAKTAVSRNSGVECASRHLVDGEVIEFGQEVIQVIATPGHTAGCLSYLWHDRVFTGDALMIGVCGRTDFQEGDAGVLFDSITENLLTLPDETLVYPAHDYEGRHVSTIAQERGTNPFLVDKNRAEFIEYQDNLDLSPPSKIQVAVPANRQCGRDVS